MFLAKNQNDGKVNHFFNSGNEVKRKRENGTMNYLAFPAQILKRSSINGVVFLFKRCTVFVKYVLMFFCLVIADLFYVNQRKSVPSVSSAFHQLGRICNQTAMIISICNAKTILRTSSLRVSPYACNNKKGYELVRALLRDRFTPLKSCGDSS